MSLLIVVLCMLFFATVLFLVTLNGTPVDVELFFHTYRQVSLSVVMTVCLMAGIAFTALLSFLDGIRIRLQNQRLRRQVGRLEMEIQQSRRTTASAGTVEIPPPVPPVDYPRI